MNLLKETKYSVSEIDYLEHGFTYGFDIGYKGPVQRQSKSKNIPLRVGSETELWNKLIKEVKLGRVAGPYDDIPYDNYIQSPIGLVPKSGNTGKTRLIFHLSYNFTSKGNPEEDENTKSLNYYTPKSLCSVKYQDLDHALQNCLKAKRSQANNIAFEETVTVDDQNADDTIYMGKSDVQSAFRLVPLSPWCWAWLIMSARNPVTKVWKYFVDKCLPFGASISCAIFQRLSNAVCHIAKVRSGQETISNYLDDFLFVAYLKSMCNKMIEDFLLICQTIGMPIALEKTEWATSLITFLGILLDGKRMTLGIPEEKRLHALYLLRKIIDKKKATVKELQQLCGYLNFLNRAVYPGRPFLRRMYAKYSQCYIINETANRARIDDEENTQKSENNVILKPYHHVRLDAEFKSDCRIWTEFLDNHNLQRIVCRPMVDVDMFSSSQKLVFYTDASARTDFGYGCVFGNRWAYGKWEAHFIDIYKPSIEYLELYALCVGLMTWQKELSNCRIIIHCDNQAVVSMVNNLTSSCDKCMVLLRIITLNGLLCNRRVSVIYIKSRDNVLSDALSRQNLVKFRKSGPHMLEKPDTVHPQMISAKRLYLLQNHDNITY